MEITIFTDGGSRGNPGQAAVGVVAKTGEETLFEVGKTIGVATNNEAEYQAFLLSLEWLTTLPQPVSKVTWKLDSKLVVEQLNKHWKVKEPRMWVYAEQCWQQLAKLAYPFSILHVLREENKRADLLLNQALDQT